MGACATSLAVSEIPTLLQELKTKFGTIPELKSKYGADGEEAERGGEDAAMQPQRHGHKVLMALSARRFCEHSAPTLILVRAHDHSAVHAPNGMSCMHPYIHTYPGSAAQLIMIPAVYVHAHACDRCLIRSSAACSSRTCRCI